MRTHIIIIVICLNALTIGCSDKPQSVGQILKFEDLPIDVQKKYKEVYNYCTIPIVNGNDTIEYMPPFIEAYNLNGDSVIIDKSMNFLNNSFSISSNGKRITVSLSILERVFIIKNDSVYYPVSGNGVTTYGEPRSYNVGVDTLLFQVSAMR